MNKTKFVYVTYIVTTLDKVWQALVKGEITSQYWGCENVSDWKVGSPWQHVRADDSRKLLMVGKVLEALPPHRLVITWADPADANDPNKQTRVTFELEQVKDMVKLTVVHDELDENSNMDRGIREGWPRVLSSMKSFLETGRAIDLWALKK